MRNFWTVLTVLVGLATSVRGQEERLFVLGFDGLDHGVMVRLMEEGKLPHLARLAKEGSARPLATTFPAISPVAWSSIITGLNPGRTGIDGFLRRDFADGSFRAHLSLGRRDVDRSGLSTRAARRPFLLIPLLFVLAASVFKFSRRRRLAGWSFSILAGLIGMLLWASEFSYPDGRPFPVNLRQGEAYWKTLDRAGIATTTTYAPCAFPAPQLDHGRLLCGLGVPDIAGTMGSWTILRTDVAKESFTTTGGRVTPLIWENPKTKDGPFRPVNVYGPPDIVGGTDRQIAKPLRMVESRDDGTLHITDGLSDRQITKGSPGDPFDFLFRLSAWTRIRGQARFRLVEMGDRVSLYLDPIGFHPGELPKGVRISFPDDFAWRLWKDVGAFETVGWACATNALQDVMIDDATFLRDARQAWDEQEANARHELKRDDARVITCIFTVPDRIQHMFTRFAWTDVDVRGRPIDPRWKQEIERAYQRADRFVGEVMNKYRKPGDHIVVVSDHGFSPWKRAVNLNALLIRKGWMTLRGPSTEKSLHDNLVHGNVFEEVDWSSTKAYSLGLGRIYLNRKGREPAGIVGDEEAKALLAEIATELRALEDDGKPVVSRVMRGADGYTGDAIPHGPADLYVGFHRGYRVSWQSCLGGCSEPVLFNNGSAWSGDHCSVDPALVPGVLVTDLKLEAGPARVVDITPTILAWAGLAWTPPSDVDGRSLLAR